MNRPNIRLRVLANGVVDEQTGRFFPFKTTQVSTGTASTKSPSVANARFYIHNLQVSVRTVAGDLTSLIAMTIPVYIHPSVNIFQVACTPGVAERFDLDRSNLGILGNPGGAVTCSFTGGDPTAFRCIMTYAEVDDV